MEYDYYPGCTLKNKASHLDICARKAAEKLGAAMTEIPEWQCCGGVYPMAGNETAQKLPAVRALNEAKSRGRDLLCVCSACYHVLKSVNYDMANNATVITKANTYLENDPWYKGETRVLHYLEMLRDDIGFEKVKKCVEKPLTGKKIASYYGCLLLRPSKIMKFDKPENPSVMESLIKALGGEPVIYPFRNECCGGYVSAEDTELTEKKVRDIVESVKAHGGEMIVTACPLCMYNLKKYGDLPVKYFTELICEAFGIEVLEDD